MYLFTSPIPDRSIKYNKIDNTRISALCQKRTFAYVRTTMYIVLGSLTNDY